MSVRCSWKDREGKRCKCVVARCATQGVEVGRYCKRHNLSIEYMPDGVLSGDGCPVVCDNVVLVRMKVRSTDDIVALGDHVFLDRDGVDYNYEDGVKEGATYILMKNGRTGLSEMFWNSREERGKRTGRLVRELCVKPYKESCEKTALVRVSGECLCEDCFEKGYNTLIDFL